jgi:hypothetical protein
MSFCALEEAFTGPPNPPPPARVRRHKSSSRGGKEGFSGAVPAALPATPGGGGGGSNSNSNSGELLAGPPPALPPSDDSGAVSMTDLFPMPGETGGADEWQKAFMLEGSAMPPPVRPDGSVPVAGKSTLWRQIPVPALAAPAAPVPIGAPLSAAPVPTELSQRLDVLTRQLESLTAPTHLQGTAELFLFVAIGLLLLLAIDTLLRFAVSAGQSVMRGGARGVRLGRRMRLPAGWY